MAASGQGSDSIEALFDFNEYDNSVSFQSPSLSPATSSKNAFVNRPISQAPTPNISTASQQSLPGPSHQYELYKQQTGIVPGALASTLAINQNSQVAGYNAMGLDVLGLSPQGDMFDFNTPPSQASFGASDLDMDFDPATTEQLFFENTVNPNALADQASSSMSSQALSPTAGSSRRLWPGMHSQAALAKAQAQRQQQHQQQLQLQQRQMNQQKPRSKSNQAGDPIVEQKITQLLNSMRAKPNSSESQHGNAPVVNLPKPRKDEEDMDEDERLLASEEGKKLSSKERRQLRNKVSARAFRSRRKEYITQLEAEIANKVSENSDLRAENRRLAEENRNLSNLTRMLLASSSFSELLDQMSTNPTAFQQSTDSQPQSSEQERRQVPKDVNPYAGPAPGGNQHIGMAMIPEPSMDMSMLSIDHSEATYNYQPQVFAVLETPEMPSSIDTALLCGKKTNFVGEQIDSDEDKMEMPALERPIAEKLLKTASAPAPPLDPEFESNPDFALFHSSPEETPAEVDVEHTWQVDIFGGLEPEKVLARYELVDASDEEQSAILTVARAERICDRLEALRERINLLTADF